MIASSIVRRRWLTYDAVLSLQGSIVFTVLNLIGAIIFIARASVAWAIPAERAAGIYSVTGEPFVWAISIFPVVLIFSLLNLGWTALILRRKAWRSGSFWLLSTVIWFAALWIDNAHH